MKIFGVSVVTILLVLIAYVVGARYPGAYHKVFG